MTVRTITLNPGFDHDVIVSQIDPGAVGSVVKWTTHAGGKGLNVSRTIRLLGGETVAYALIGASDQVAFTALAARDGYAVTSVTVEQSTRNNLTLRIGTAGTRAGHAAGRRFVKVPECAVHALFEKLVDDICPGDVVSFNGSLPEGFRPTAWADLASSVRRRKALLFADVQGAAMVPLLRTGYVRAAKPNQEESGVLVHPGDGGDSHSMAISAVRKMHLLGVADPIVTLGPLGAVHIGNGYLLGSECPPDNANVEVGAGDAFVAGYCAALDAAAWKGHHPVTLGLAAASAHVDQVEEIDMASQVRRRLARTSTHVIERL